MDVPELFLIAAAVLEVDPTEVIDRAPEGASLRRHRRRHGRCRDRLLVPLRGGHIHVRTIHAPRPQVTSWTSPIDPALVARRGRLLGDIQAVLDENQRLRDEVAHLRMLLHEHGIDPGGDAGEESA